MNLEILDDVVQVNDEECFVWARRLANRKEFFTGGLGRRMYRWGAARGEKLKERGPAGGVSPGLRLALSEQSLQRRLDAGARLRGKRK